MRIDVYNNHLILNLRYCVEDYTLYKVSFVDLNDPMLDQTSVRELQMNIVYDGTNL